MAKFNEKISMRRYRIMAWVVLLLAICIICKAGYIMTVKRSYWTEVSDRLIADSVPVKPTRGNILSCDNQLLASSLPEYKLFVDFRALYESENDTLWAEYEDSICQGLHDIFPQKSVEEFRKHLRAGMEKEYKDKNGNVKKGSRHWPIWPKRVNYSTFSEVKKLPIFRLSPYKGGFHVTHFNARTRPNGTLASRTIGEMYGAIDSARCGLELYYDSILRGKEGLINRRKVRRDYLSIMIQEPVDGADIVTTLDVNIQDLAEEAVTEEMEEIGAELGVAIVMETKTGDIKALVNLSRVSDGKGGHTYREIKNNAVSDLVEPGSVFKTASILAALEDGKIDTTSRYNVDTGGGTYKMYGRQMRDHNWRRGGYGVLSVPKILHVSSNIGVSRLIDRAYHDEPEKFVERIHSMGLGIDLDLPFPGAQKHAIVRMPKKNSRGQYTNWAKTTLPWMSIGYETQIPPIFTVAFYNAIANNGRFMQPRFVKEVQKEGKTIKKYEPVCLIEKICSEEPLRKIQTILEGVVSQGLGKKAGSKSFRVAGKTGTAQIADEKGSYKSGRVRYWLSFCGYFPYENPEYTCIVCLKKTGLPASGGGMAGAVFHNIAEGIMAKRLKHNITVARDSTSILIPDVKNGNMEAATYVLKDLNIRTEGGASESGVIRNSVWANAKREKNSVRMTPRNATPQNLVPDVEGMGARDAVYKLESHGLKVKINGCGRVKKQSIAPNTKIKKGMCITIELG